MTVHALPAADTRKLYHHVDPAADPPAGVGIRTRAAPHRRAPDGGVDTWPLYTGDPVQVGAYRLLSRLGVGGMADVFYAEAPTTGRPVAVKILRASDGAATTCRREYRLASSVDDNCTAPALGYGASAAGAYLVTAYLPGFRSATTLVGSSMPDGRVWEIGADLARVLAAVHAGGVVHCDVKPSNLLVRGNDVRLIDFGIARHVGRPASDDDIVEYSPGWAAPEQLYAVPATPAVDIFAWGCLLALLASGVHPFAGDGGQEWLLRIQSARPDLSGLPLDLAEVVGHTLARDPRKRPSARELNSICQARGDPHAMGLLPRIERTVRGIWSGIRKLEDRANHTTRRRPP